jgi:hypothetical protein
MTARPRIAFFGSSLVSAYWNGAATYYRGLLRELHARGYRVTFYEPDAYGRQAHRDLEEPPWARIVVYAAADERPVWRAVEEARAADVVVKTSGVGVFDELLERAVLDVRRPGALVIFWDVDAPATLDRLEARPDARRRRAGRPGVPGARRARVRPYLQRARPGGAPPGAARCAVRGRPGVPGQPAARSGGARG